MTIFLLEDNHARIVTFKKLLSKKFPEAELTIAIEASQAKRLLSNSHWDVIFLDHDLGGKVFVDSSESNTGYQVAKYIKESNISYGQIITHTQNSVGGENIVNLLKCEHVPFPMLIRMLE